MAHQEFGVRLLEKVKADLEPYGVVENFPRMEGRQMVMVLGPKKKDIKVAAPQKPRAPKPPRPEGAAPETAAEPKPAEA